MQFWGELLGSNIISVYNAPATVSGGGFCAREKQRTQNERGCETHASPLHIGVLLALARQQFGPQLWRVGVDNLGRDRVGVDGLGVKFCTGARRADLGVGVERDEAKAE